MEKRNLRVTKWLGTVPAVAVCTSCAREFKVPFNLLKRTSDAQETLRKQFAEHKCNPHDSTQNAPGITREATDDK
jgi:hypothetical protein